MSGTGVPEPEIALVLSPDSWVERLHRHCADHGGARVRCIVVEPSVALDEEYHVLVATDRWPAMTRPFVESLHARGRRVLLVCDDEDEVAARELGDRLGVDDVMCASADAAAIVAAVVTLAVDARQSQLLAAALADGDFVLTRVTGAPSSADLPPLVTARPAR